MKSSRSRARQPLVGVALAAVAGILAADLARRIGPAATDTGVGHLLPWIGLGVGVLAAVLFFARRRRRYFYPFVALAFAALHLFYADPVAETVLAQRLHTKGNHILRGTGAIAGVPRALPSKDPQAPATTWRAVLDLEDSAAVDGEPLGPAARVNLLWRDGPQTLADGDRLEVTALAVNVAEPRNPGEFSYAALDRRRGIFSEVRVAGLADGLVLQSAATPWLDALAERVHDWMERTLRIDLDDDPAAGSIVSTMLLGLRDDPGLGDLQEIFQRTGTLHYFAIDGLKLGLVAAVLLRAFDSFGVSRAWSGALAIPLLATYALATGLGPASARALLIAAVLVGGRWLSRPARPLNHLAAVALLLLLFDTNQLFGLGFQLTFLVVLSILLLAPPLSRWLLRFGAPDAFLPRPLFTPTQNAREWLRTSICELAAVAVAAWLGSLPVMAWYFGVISPISPLANLVTFPLAFTLVAVGTLSLAGGWISTLWAAWMNNTNWLVAHALLAVVRWCDAVPGGSLTISDPTLWHWGKAPVAEFTLFDLGAGRAARLHAGGSDWLIDAGRPATYTHIVQPALRGFGVTRLNGGLLLTRADADHLGAASLLAANFHPARIVEGNFTARSPALRELRSMLAQTKQSEVQVERGDFVTLGDGVELRIVYPPEETRASAPATAANRALALQIQVAPTTNVMWLSDTGDGAAARWLMEHANPAETRSDVLVCDAPVTAQFIQATGARLVVIRPAITSESPATAPNQAQTLPGVSYLTQDESGAIELSCYPDRLEARGFVDGRILTLAPAPESP